MRFYDRTEELQDLREVMRHSCASGSATSTVIVP